MWSYCVRHFISKFQMSIDNDKFQFVSQFNCTHFNYLYANFTRCTHFLRGVRKLYQNRCLHTQKNTSQTTRVFLLCGTPWLACDSSRTAHLCATRTPSDWRFALASELTSLRYYARFTRYKSRKRYKKETQSNDSCFSFVQYTVTWTCVQKMCTRQCFALFGRHRPLHAIDLR